MEVRYPDFDLDGFDAHWTPQVEVAQMVNAFHLVPVYIEPFLIKVMRKVKAQLDAVADAELIADIDIFNKQEGQHTKVHGAYFRAMRDCGYGDAMAGIERDYAAEYERFLADKPLRFLLAYCEAFEAFASTTSAVWVDVENAEYFVGAQQVPIDIWRWHLAEEFEHRTVVFRAYERLYGRPRVRSYLYRVRIFFYTQAHMGKFTKRLTKALIAHDHASMSESERVASRKRARSAELKMTRRYIPRVFRPLSPWYDPADAPAPIHQDEILARYSVQA